MAHLDSCPSCGRTAEDDDSSNHFDVYTCRKCSEKYCRECGDGDGTTCPSCGSTSYSKHDKVYAQ